MIFSQELLSQRKFLPLFVTQLLGALNDNVLRGAIGMYISYFLFDDVESATFWTSISTAMFLVPSLLLSAISGELADKYQKVILLRAVKFVEIFIVIFTGYLLLTEGTTPLALVSCVFLMGAHSAVFGPAKFAYLPEYLEDDELLPANGLIEGSTFAMIAIGAGLSSLIGYKTFGATAITSLMILFALGGWLASLLIPPNRAQNPELKIKKNILISTQEKIDLCSHNPELWIPILGISWFWVVGLVHMTNLANYVQYTLHYNSFVVGFLNAVFTIGIAIGSLLCNKALKGEVHTRLVPMSLFLTAIFGFHLYAGSYSSIPAGSLGTLKDFLTTLNSYRIIFDMLAISVFSGLFVVPLYAILQHKSPADKCAQVIAASNIVSAVFMVCTTAVSVLLTQLKFSLPQLFLFTATLNLGLSMFLLKILPFSSVKPILARLFRWLFDVEVQGLEHFVSTDDQLIVIANHVSFLDAIFLALFLPGDYIFAVDTHIAKRWYVKIIKLFVTAYDIDPANPIRIKSIAKEVKSGKRCIIFPEGRLTNTGSLMKVYEGTAALAQMSQADVISVNLSGLQYSKFSRLHNIYRLKFFTKVKITILPKFKIAQPDAV